MYKQIEFGDDARQKMKQGIDKVANTVKRTMGVQGKNVLLKTNPYGRPLITNDGVTIARDLILQDRVENAGAEMIREVAEKTNDNAGDGTTSTMILMQAIVDKGMKLLASGVDGIELRKGITTAIEKLLTELEAEKRPADDLESLAATATISCRNPEIGAMIAEVVKQAGIDGMVTIEDRYETDTIHERQEGLKLTGGYLLEQFINLPERRQTVFSDVPVLVTDRTITLGEEMAKIMEVVSRMTKKEAIVIAGGIEGDALLTSLVNWQKKAIFILPVRVLTYGDLGQGLLKDVAAITGATYLDEHEKSLLDITPEDFGRASKTVTDRRETTIVSDDEELKLERIKDLEAAIDSATEFEQENLRERIAKLKSAMFTIKVGGKTESDRNELKTRVDDAIKATKAALESGVVAGGGSALYRAQSNLDYKAATDTELGETIVYEACTVPIEQMADNSAIRLDRSDLKKIATDPKSAIDFTTGDVVNAYKAGIIDPYKVVSESLQNAATQAGLFLTLDAAVLHVEPEKNESI